jgi:hypothetical protein
MLMYTSCGWFYSEVSGLETVQILKYAARALQLAREASGADQESVFEDALERAPSNVPEYGNARRVYQECVQPSVASLETVAAHHAIAGLVEDNPRRDRIFCHEIQTSFLRREHANTATLALARVEVRSILTQEKLDLTTCVLHFSRPGAGRLQQGDGRGVIGHVNPKTQFERPMIHGSGAHAVQVDVRNHGSRLRSRMPREVVRALQIFLFRGESEHHESIAAACAAERQRPAIMLEIIGWSAKYDPKTAADRDFVRRLRREPTGLAAGIRSQLVDRRAEAEASPPRAKGARASSRRKTKEREVSS